MEVCWGMVLVLAVAGVTQGLDKDEKAMLIRHSAECLSESKADPKLVNNLLNGQLIDHPALKKHVFCILLKCKMVSKDGKLQKTALLGKMPKHIDLGAAVKMVESCADPKGDTPVEIAWNFFKCAYYEKHFLFDESSSKNSDVNQESLKNIVQGQWDVSVKNARDENDGHSEYMFTPPGSSGEMVN